ncbi:MAG: hypothetical protein DHS20C18_47310 [Saprospiraceae bacterium]|nr:MAG: hypothetical protein DHS20C18_47310 [Saprospiraceae bacterium]
MQNSKLIELLKVLDAAELKRLLSFLKSPFYNANPHIVKLYLILRTYFPDFASPKLDKQHVFKKLFPKRVYDHQKLLNLMSDFTTLVKRYLSVLQLEKEEQLQDRLLLKAFAERPDSYNVFVKQIQKTDSNLDKLPYRNKDFHQQKFWLSQLYFNHPGTDKFELSKAQYDASMQQLDRWFLLEKLLLSCEIKAREKPLSEKYDIWLLQEIREGVSHFSAGDPIATAYLEMLQLLEEEEPSAYYNLKALLMNHLPQFTRLQQQNILQSLINFTIREGNRGDVNFLKENLDLYKFGLAEQLFFEYGILNDMTYISIVNIALRTKDLAWCLEFINTNEKFLEPRARKDAKTLATALWLYAEQKPDATIELLHKVDFLNVYYQIQARVLLIKVYFEAFQKNDAYFELVHAQSEAFERYLRRNKKVSKAQGEALLNFALSVKRLAKLKTGIAFEEQSKRTFIQELHELKPLYNKSWLLRQID